MQQTEILICSKYKNLLLISIYFNKNIIVTLLFFYKKRMFIQIKNNFHQKADNIYFKW